MESNSLAAAPIGSLICRFAVPAIISGLVSALYNIVDQIFIGQYIGTAGNAATNIAFPLVTVCTGLSLLLGVGSASNFSLYLGKGDTESAARVAGTGISCMAICGAALCACVLYFLPALMYAFGARGLVFEYAATYTGITAAGFPFLIFGTAASMLIRADGSPKYAMYSILSGAVLNCILDALFIIRLHMGIAGAAYATVTGQIVSAVIVCCYLFRFKQIRLLPADFVPRLRWLKRIAALGCAACFNQLAMMAVQITMNNTLGYYGELSRYGRDIPLACVGVIIKVNVVFIAIMVGIAQGCQPVWGFNYGARNYERVTAALKKALVIVYAVSVSAFCCFQLFPRQIMSLFGTGQEMYFEFGERYLRVFMFCMFTNGAQPVATNFFSSIGKATRGILISLSRQILLLLPLILIFSRLWGIDGVLYAGPVADGTAAGIALLLLAHETRHMRALSAGKNTVKDRQL